MNNFFENRGFWFKSITLIIITIAAAFVSVVFGTVFAAVFFGQEKLAAQHIDTILFLQGFISLVLFTFSPLVFAKCFKEDLLIKKRPKILSVLTGLTIMVVSMPFCSFLEDLNLRMQLPDFLSGLENWMRLREKEAADLTEKILSYRTSGYICTNILIIALIPALGEELYFRSCIQNCLFINQAKLKALSSILITAMIFSAIHLQFYGFLPRMFLGSLLGLMLVITKNTWVPVICHFFNNASAILMGKDLENTSMQELPQFLEYKSTIIISLILTIGLFWAMKKIDKK